MNKMMLSPMTPSARPHRRALIVGADPATLRSCSDALESSGFGAHAVDTGIAAVVAAREELPDLILIEVQLSDVPGREAIKWLRSIPALQFTPIIVLTAEAVDDEICPPAPSLRKPVSPSAIWRTIHEIAG
ncbi:MAG TPA: response regulator [Methylocella sp.]